MSKVIGIDLGTTNSCMAYMDNGSVKIIPNSEGDRTTPSVVAFTEYGERLIGKKAKNQAIVNPKRTVSSIKRKMGSSFSVDIDGKKFNPQEISAMILSKMKKDAETYLNEEINDVVITVPAYFTDAQRQATKDAGSIAGLNVLRIINEPTAAALAYGLDKTEEQKILVFDFGGGTLDVSILDINSGVIEVLATAGNNMLGGDDFDNIICDYLLESFKKKEHIDLSKDLAALVRLKEASEKAKITLSQTTSTLISLPFIYMKGANPINFELELTRNKFDELTKDIIKKAKDPILEALKGSKLKFSNLSKVLMVGGSSRIPAVVNMVENVTKLPIFKGINPDECVAMGAAIQSGVLTGTVGDLLLIDVMPLSLGIMTIGDHFAKIIEGNSPIPIKQSQIFSTASPYQSNVEIQVLQGERERASANKLLGKFILKGIRRAPAGVPQIEVTFDVDTNGIVNVSARDLDTGKNQEITITSSNNLSQEEIQRARNEALKYQQEDEERLKNIDLVNEANSLIRNANTKIKENKKLKKELKPLIKETEKCLYNKDYLKLKDKVEELKRHLN